MILEGLTISVIIGSCAFFAWIVKNKFQPEIEKEIEKQKQKEIKLEATIKNSY